MTPSDILKWAVTLHTARLSKLPIEQISDSDMNDTGQAKTSFLRQDAYAIQEAGIGMRERDGEKLIGIKMGLTSEAKRKQMDLDSPLYGELTDKMQIPNGGNYNLSPQIHPKIEPEVAFLIGNELKGNVSREDVLAATTEIYPCMEILDSRYKQFKYFSMEDVISDNSSSSHFVLGPGLKDFRHLDLANLNLEMKVNGEVVQSGNTSAISGDPVVSVIQLCELLMERKRCIPAGTIVLAGAATIAVQLEEGMTVELEMEGLEKTSVTIIE